MKHKQSGKNFKKNILTWLHKLGYTLKKVLPSKTGRKSTQIFANLFRYDEFVVLDESEIEDNACREYGWNPANKRCLEEDAFHHNRQISMIAGLCDNLLIALFIF